MKSEVIKKIKLMEAKAIKGRGSTFWNCETKSTRE